MNKTELIAAIAEQAEISKKDAEKAFRSMMESYMLERMAFMWNKCLLHLIFTRNSLRLNCIG